MDQLYQLGWHLCARKPSLMLQWRGDLFFRNKKAILILETTRKHIAAHITADILGPIFVSAGFNLYYCHLDSRGRIRGLYQWFPADHIKTVCI